MSTTREQNSKDRIILFREWLDDRKRIYATSQCCDAVVVLNSVISMYDAIFNTNSNQKITDNVLEKTINSDASIRLQLTMSALTCAMQWFNEWNYNREAIARLAVNIADDTIKILNASKKVDNANKIEPKFKVRDLIVNGSANPCYVKSIFGDYYELCYYEGFEYTKHIKDVDNNYHLWTIQDAKDGDILLTKYDKPFIYNGRFNNENVGAYGGISNSGEEFLKSYLPNNWTSKEGVKPATKEQRALLFEKMREAGYTWDADKLELKRK